jgi:hypothetical protein
MLTHGAAGTGGAEAGLNAQQLALFRAGHAHAGVWLLLSLVIQVLLDAARLPSSTKWLARIAAPVGTSEQRRRRVYAAGLRNQEYR